MICNVNIYPDEDLNRWSVCKSFDILENYYTKGEVDAKIADIEVDVDLSNYYTKGETNTLLDGKLDASAYTPTDLSGYATQEWVNDKHYITQLKPIWGLGNFSDSINLAYGYGIHNNVRIESEDVLVEINTGDRNGSYDYIIPHSLKPIAGLGEYDSGMVNGLLVQYGDFAIGKWNDSNVTYDSSEDRYVPSYFSIGNGTDANNRHNIFTVLQNGKILLEDDRILQNWLADVEDAANSAASNVDSKQDALVSGWNIKTINGQSLLGEGNITISGGSADLSNYYNKQEIDGFLSNAEGMLTAISGVVDTKADSVDTYTKTEVNSLLDDKLDASAYTPTDLSNYYNKTEVDNLLANKPDASNVYTKTEVNNLVNNKFACMTQAEYDALAVKENDVLYLIY